ncbi:MAG: hypothetical protein IPM29_00975 [Planctomycetes bacterium]|nr:hypothetical protein [Planctomycetota bacterium]
MGRRSGELYEILSKRSGRATGGDAGGHGSAVGAGVGRALEAGRGVLGWFERVRHGRGRSRGAQPPASGLVQGGLVQGGGAALLIAALASLLVGFGIGRWTASPAAAKSGQGELRSSVGDGGLRPDWLGGNGPQWLSTRREVSLPRDAEEEKLSQFGVLLLTYPAPQRDHAAAVAAWLRSEGVWDARLRPGRVSFADRPAVDGFAVVCYAPDEAAVALRTRLAELNPPDGLGPDREVLVKVLANLAGTPTTRFAH